MPQARVIVFGNEKGGAGKSTIAIHLITALLHEGATVATIDLDLRQQSMGHFFNSRRAWSESAGAVLPMPLAHILAGSIALAKTDPADAAARFDALFGDATAEADYLVEVVVPDLEHYRQFLVTKLLELPLVTEVRSNIAISTLKAGAPLPLGHLDPSRSP